MSFLRKQESRLFALDPCFRRGDIASFGFPQQILDMKRASDIVMKLLAALLLTAAVLKGWQLLTEPVANSDIWSYRPFLILTVEFELALGIWLLSGLFKKAAWLAALLCFSAFSAITLYKVVTGAASCGCFGTVHVNPWITLFAIDLPAVIALVALRPNHLQSQPVKHNQPRFATVAIIALSVNILAGVAMISYKRAVLTAEGEFIGDSKFVVLEPEKWIGKCPPILEYVEINNDLANGKWIAVFYYHGCSDCGELMPKVKSLVCKTTGHPDDVNLAFIEVPPYRDNRSEIDAHNQFTYGRLSKCHDWFVVTPTVVYMVNGKVHAVWKKHLPDTATIAKIITST